MTPTMTRNGVSPGAKQPFLREIVQEVLATVLPHDLDGGARQGLSQVISDYAVGVDMTGTLSQELPKDQFSKYGFGKDAKAYKLLLPPNEKQHTLLSVKRQSLNNKDKKARLIKDCTLILETLKKWLRDLIQSTRIPGNDLDFFYKELKTSPCIAAVPLLMSGNVRLLLILPRVLYCGAGQSEDEKYYLELEMCRVDTPAKRTRPCSEIWSGKETSFRLEDITLCNQRRSGIRANLPAHVVRRSLDF